ncbi:DUF1272 domain-containing protein [Mesobacillus foraminis]|uniref:DUF1272 domain-containing protein n=1 Tax=Mesobacillus foraminis TaxID=279826 RepID=UPI00281104DE|nr:DUF1272 domain-containing protein [Mesobacillus foraminis]
MRKECERSSSSLEEQFPAFICVYECMFYASCTEEMNHVCPNCGGELVRRPRPKKP